MAVIITRKDCTLSEANAFYRVEAYNAAHRHPLTSSYLTISQYGIAYPLTFANAGTFKGVVATIVNAVTNSDCGVYAILLRKNNTCTCSISSPGIVTLNGHGYTGDEPIVFRTTGALPTGITINRTYYVKYINANTFYIATTVGGSNINFTGTQSGTHSVYDVTSTATKTYNEVQLGITNGGGKTINNGYINYYTNSINFDNFDTDVSVDTTADKWMLLYRYNGTVGAPFMWPGITLNEYFFFAYCDNQVSFTDADTVVFAHYCDIDQSFTLGGVLGDGETVEAVCALICSNPRATGSDDVSFLRCLNPTAPYTMTLKGAMIINGRAGFRVGTETNRVTAANQFKVVFDAPIVGTSYGNFNSVNGYFSNSYRISARGHIYMYGEYPTTIGTTLSANASSGQNKINVVGDISGWSNGDTISIGNQTTNGNGELKTYTINSINGQEITLTGNLTGSTRASGGPVINFNSSRFGIVLYGNSPAALSSTVLVSHPSSIIIDGAYTHIYYHPGNDLARHYCDDSDDFVKGIIYKNIVCFSNLTGHYTMCGSSVIINRKGLTFENWWGYRMIPMYCSAAAQWYSSKSLSSGTLTYKNVYIDSAYQGWTGGDNAKVYIDNFNNCNQRASYGLYLALKPGSIIKNVNIFYCSSYAIYFNFTTVDTYFENIYLDGGTNYGLGFTSTCVVLNTKFVNLQIAQRYPFLAGNILNSTGLINITLKNSKGLSFLYSENNDAVLGTQYMIIDKEGVAGVDEVYSVAGNFVKCGTDLSDTTVLGTNIYSLRFEPNLPGTPLEWVQTIPIGNIQSKTMVVMCKVKINSANYYAGADYMLPRLTVTYDDGTETYAIASNSTSEQTLVVPFSPTTTYGQIKVKVSGYTDATGTDAYFYVGDGQVLYPAGHQINTGDFFLWADAMPVVPWIATNLQAADVWAYLKDSIQTVGSIGEFLKTVAVEANATTNKQEIIEAIEDVEDKVDLIPTNSEMANTITKVDELHKLQGLDVDNPTTVTPNSRTAGDIELIISGDGENLTVVTRKE